MKVSRRRRRLTATPPGSRLAWAVACCLALAVVDLRRIHTHICSGPLPRQRPGGPGVGLLCPKSGALLPVPPTALLYSPPPSAAAGALGLPRRTQFARDFASRLPGGWRVAGGGWRVGLAGGLDGLGGRVGGWRPLECTPP